jgi:predicted HTH transcriptional regulator|tara:strand:- start:674 stop:934 length:261 start_codon:yes stop_codon:yes gene_type:complete
MYKKLTKKEKIINLLNKGNNVTWKHLRARFNLKSPTAMIDTIKKEGHVVYTNKTSEGVAYRMGKPSAAIIAAGIAKVLGVKYAYKS